MSRVDYNRLAQKTHTFYEVLSRIRSEDALFENKDITSIASARRIDLVRGGFIRPGG
jgi:hypothetical protein